MAVAHGASTTSQTANNQSNTSLSVAGLSTSSSDLNVIDIQVMSAGTGNPTIATPSGWSKLSEAIDSNSSYSATIATFYKFGAAASSVTVSWTTAGQAVAVASYYSGVDTTTPIPSYTLGAKTTTDTSYSVSVATSLAGWIRSGFGNRSGITFSGMADTARGSATLSGASSLAVQDSAGNVSSGTITRTATGSGNTSVGTWFAYLIAPSAGGGVTHTLTIKDNAGVGESGASTLTVVESINDRAGLSDSTTRVLTPGAVTPPTTDPDFTALVEIAFGDTPRSAAPTFTDVADYVRAATVPSMSRGRSNEFDPQAQPGRARVEFKNTDGRFTVGNDSSPYAPLRIRRPIRFRMAYGGNVYPLWSGFVDSWDNERDETTGVASVDASDRLARAGTMQLKGLVAAEILADSPSAYFPLGDDGSSLTAGDQSTVIGNPPLRIGGDEANDVSFGVGATPGPDSGTVVAFTVGGGET